jgi:excisionase family DNA binding protein
MRLMESDDEPQEAANECGWYHRAFDYFKHVAQYIGATSWRVEEMLRKGELRFFWVGKAKVVDREDVDAWIDSQKELVELKKMPALTDAEAQAFFEGVEKDEDGNIILRFGSEED